MKIHDITEVILKALTPQETAALFPLVLGAAREHDAVAKRLCLEAGRELAELALALATRLGWRRREFIVVMAGGVFGASARIRRSFSLALHSATPRARIVLLRRPAVEGALALAVQS